MTAPAPRRVLVTGGRGQLGRELGRRLSAWRTEHWLLDLPECDVTDPASMERHLGEIVPDLVIHAAAYTRVDDAEREPTAAEAVNSRATADLARLCASRGIPLIYVSTDFVFDGQKGSPYEVDDPADPLNVYGRTKRRGEVSVLASGARAWIVRTSWLYGAHGANFPKAILRRASDGTAPRVVSDQTGSPTYAADLAYALCAISGVAPGAAAAPPGIYHYANQGHCSWWEFAVEILARAGWLARSPDLAPVAITGRELARPARRPAYSVLGLGKIAAAGVPLRPWREALDEFLAELRPLSPELFPGPDRRRPE